MSAAVQEAPLRVLVVSSDPWWARVACALVGHAGHRAQTTDDALGRVLRLVRKERPDVVLLMVEADGCTELATALASRRRGAVPMVLATRDTGAWEARGGDGDGLDGLAVVEAWSQPGRLVASVEAAGRRRLQLVAAAGPDAATANVSS